MTFHKLNIILPNWDVPVHVRALSTTRIGGVSSAPFKSFNLAHHVGDHSESVQRNRKLLEREWLLPDAPHWLNQTHSTDVIELSDKVESVDADAAWTEQKSTVCAVLTADCLPLLFYHPEEQKVAAVHAGWRGLLDGVIENTLDAMTDFPEQMKVWLGPAIGPDVFEVGPEVREQFMDVNSASESCFTAIIGTDKYLADIYALARMRLQKIGIQSIKGGDYCTYSDSQRFYSYRRDGTTGRQATIIWMDEL